MSSQRVNAPGLGRLPSFSHAVIAGETIYVSGTLGTSADSLGLVEGGAGPQTTQALRNIEHILQTCGAALDDLVKVNVYLADIATFSEMNEAYIAVMGDNPPARITVGGNDLALGAAVEIDAIAYKPQA